MGHPFPYIKELSDVETITGFNDLLKIMSFVYSTVPWVAIPYEGQLNLENVEILYHRFKKLEIGGWCGLNIIFLSHIIEGYRRQDPWQKESNPFRIHYRFFNYGIQQWQLTHMGVIVEVDHLKFLLDPYYNRYYVHKDGFPLQFENLIHLIKERKFDKYKIIYLDAKKPIINGDNFTEYLSPQDLFKRNFVADNHTQTMQEVFNSTNQDLLMLLEIV